MTVPVCAIVLASRGGAPLAAALEALAWAGERAVLDPAGVVRATDLPANVHVGRRVDEVAALGTQPWLLLLGEPEEATAALPAAAADAIVAGPAGLRPRLELDTLGLRFTLPAAPIRLAPRAACRLAIDRSCVPGLATPYPPRALDAAIRVHAGDTVAAAFELLQSDGRLASRLLAQLAPAERGRRAASPLAALARVLRARADHPAGLARWVAAVFAGYRVVLARAQCWEWRHAQPALLREVG